MKKSFAALLLLTALVAFAGAPPAKSLRIATVSQPQLIRPQAAALREIDRLARLAKLDGAELALFPEVVVNGFDPADSAYESPDGPAYRELGKIAANLKLYLAVGMKVRDDKGLKRNALVVFSPEGKAVYTYFKCFMPPDELSSSVPGPADPPVWNSPWGKIGLAICWDMNCDALFEHYARENVKLILFSTYFPAGKILNRRCFELGMHAVSSHAQGFESYVIDDIGRTTATADMFSPVMTRTVNLNSAVRSLTRMDLVQKIREKYGDKLTIETFRPEARVRFSADPGTLDIDQVMNEFNFPTVRAQMAEEERNNAAARVR